MIKKCLVCGSLKDFGGNVNATTCPDCLRTGHKYCSGCHTIKSLDQFGKAGKNALGEVRYTGECKGCLKLRQAQYYAKNKEHIKAATDAYRRANLPKYVEYTNRYKAQHPEARKSQVSMASKTYRATPHGAMVVKRHNEQYNRRARLGDLTAAQWQGILEYFNFKCAYCDSTERLSMEHIQPVSKGGALTKTNIIVACQHCNSSRGNMNFEVWLDMIPEGNKAKIMQYINEGHKSIE